VAHDFDGVRRVLEAIVANVRLPPEEVDIGEVMRAVELLLDRSIATKGYVIREKKGKGDEYGGQRVDLSKIDLGSTQLNLAEGFGKFTSKTNDPILLIRRQIINI